MPRALRNLLIVAGATASVSASLPVAAASRCTTTESDEIEILYLVISHV